MRNLAAVPAPAPETDSAPGLAYDLTIAQLAERLSVTRSKIEDDVAAGLPHLDIGRPRPRPAGLPAPRHKRALRFSWPEVVAWYRQRGAA